MEISKAKIKIIASLRERKHRRSLKMFAAEGDKIVTDTLGHFNLNMLAATSSWIASHDLGHIDQEKIFSASPAQMKQMSALSTAPAVIAVYDMPETSIPEADELKGSLTLLLDDIQDPGNLGTIMRCADWFGIRQIIASPHTVDIFNPKALQSTMGAISRVKITYADLEHIIDRSPDIPLCGMLLEGESIYNCVLPEEAFILMGNEGSGISEALRKRITNGLLIPPYPADANTVDSLNVAMATAITLAEFRRQALKHC